jgi:hypothetical protein
MEEIHFWTGFIAFPAADADFPSGIGRFTSNFGDAVNQQEVHCSRDLTCGLQSVSALELCVF